MTKTQTVACTETTAFKCDHQFQRNVWTDARTTLKTRTTASGGQFHARTGAEIDFPNLDRTEASAESLSEADIEFAEEFRDPAKARANLALFRRLKSLEPRLGFVFDEADQSQLLAPDQWRMYLEGLLAALIGPYRQDAGDELLFSDEAHDAVMFVLAWDSNPEHRDMSGQS
jgi:hypothetical protein